MEIQKPIFIVGSGRSGSTVLHRMLTEHPVAAWISVLSERYPSRPEWNRWLLRSIDLPVIGSLIKQRFKPTEAYAYWEEHCRGFRRPIRDLFPSDVTNLSKANAIAAMQAVPAGDRNRLLIKITGWPRLGFLNEIFPDAKFVHILRDGRAVANSFLNVDFWWGWRGPENWRLGPLSPENAAIWNHYNRSFVALAGLQWNIFMKAMEDAQLFVDPRRFLMVKYEELCADPTNELKKIVSFCELPWVEKMTTVGNEYKVKSRNPKWQEDLTPAQQQILQNVTSGYLRKYGYLSTTEMPVSENSTQLLGNPSLPAQMAERQPQRH